MNVGLFFGSFNPIHNGHLIIANHLINYTKLDQVWMVVSPHNPLKDKKSLAKDYDRLHLVNLGIGDNTYIKACDTEFYMPKPSYTIDTLTYLKEKHPDKSLYLIMGGDNLASLHKWKNYEKILSDHFIYVYKRPSNELGQFERHENIKIVEAPLLQISASFIRKCIAENKSIRYLVPEKVFHYLEETHIYKNLSV